MKKELKVPRIKDGSVIDHITAGNAVKVLHILGIPKASSSTVSVAMNVRSKLGKKDIVKVENRELDPQEVDKIALIAPKATINIIRDYEVAKKHKVKLPDEIVGIVTETDLSRTIDVYSEAIQELSEFYVNSKNTIEKLLDDWGNILIKLK